MESLACSRRGFVVHSLVAVLLDIALATTGVVTILQYSTCFACMCVAIVLVSGLTCCQPAFILLASDSQPASVLNALEVKRQLLSFFLAIGLVIVLFESMTLSTVQLIFVLSCAFAKIILMGTGLAFICKSRQSDQAGRGRGPFDEELVPENFTFDEPLASGSCYICLEDFVLGVALSKLPCKHVFHKACVMSWIKEKNQCPLRCRPAKSLTQEQERGALREAAATAEAAATGLQSRIATAAPGTAVHVAL